MAQTTLFYSNGEDHSKAFYSDSNTLQQKQSIKPKNNTPDYPHYSQVVSQLGMVNSENPSPAYLLYNPRVLSRVFHLVQQRQADGQDRRDRQNDRDIVAEQCQENADHHRC